MEDLERVSVIIPVYNCKRYLPQCLQSILHQTYGNIEIIIVDDGSTDGTSSLCDEYAKQFPVITVIHQNNAGPGMARNAGLDIMTGDYVTYVDADDYVAKNFVETMVKLLKSYHADIAEVSLICLERMRNTFELSDETIHCFDGADLLIKDYFSEKKQLRNCVGGRMYDMNKFRNIRFSEKSIGEDSEYSLQMLSNCQRLVKYHKCLYVCRAYQESLTRTGVNHKNFDVVEICLRDIMLVENKEIELDNWEYVFQNFIGVCYGLLQRIASSGKEKEFESELENMKVIWGKMEVLALRHNIELSDKLIEDIQCINIWAKEYRKKNLVSLRIIKPMKNWISGIIAAYKRKIMYEYRFED